MKLFSVLLGVVSFITTTAKSQSPEEALKTCWYWYGLNCDDYQYSYLPYKEQFKGSTTFNINGNFTELTIDSNYVNLEEIFLVSSNLQNFRLQDYADFANLRSMQVYDSKRVLNVNFTGAEKYPDAVYLQFRTNTMLNYSCEDLNSSKLQQLELYDNSITEFNFNCVPSTMSHLSLEYNSISQFHSFESLKSLSNLVLLQLNNNDPVNRFDFGDLPENIKEFGFSYNNLSELDGCDALRNLLSLSSVLLYGNSLTDFNFACLPPNVEHLDLHDNNITEVINLTQIPTSHPFELGIYHNPIRCTCSLLRDYVQLLDSGNVTFFGGYEEPDTAITCGNTDSELAAYPWGNDAAAIRSYDASALGCLTTL